MKVRWRGAFVAIVMACRSSHPPVLGGDAAIYGFDGAGPIEEEPPCTFTGLACDGETPYRCTPSGGRQDLAPCTGDRPFCVPGGCVACIPDAMRCDPDDVATPQRCASDGSRWVPLATCDAAAGERCTDGRCGDPCAVVDGSRAYLGCEYWATQTPNSQLDPAFPFAVALGNPQTFAVTVRISGGALAAPRSIDLAPGEVRAETLPWVPALVQFASANPGCADGTSLICRLWPSARTALVRGGAYHLEATAPVAAYQFNPLTFERPGAFHSYTNDASLLLAQRVLTQRYLVVTAPNWQPLRNVLLGGFIAVTAVTGETTSVTLHLPARAGVSSATDTIEQHNLTPGDVYLLVGDQAGDLSGTFIEASAPVAVFAGHDCTNVPQDRPACDHLEEQVPPLETLGRDFVIGPLVDRPALPSVVRVVAAQNDTVLRFDPASLGPPARLAAHEVFETNVGTAFRMRASRPVLVAQFMIGQGLTSAAAGDPAMVYEVPTQQYRDRYDFLVPDTYTNDFLNVVVPRGAPALLDGTEISGPRSTVGPWDLLSTTVAPGAHRLRAGGGVPLGVKVYGTARYTAYMYPGGLDLQLIAPE